VSDDASPLGKLEIVPELMCVQQWAAPISNQQEPALGHNGNQGMPRVRMCACGPSHSGAIDVNGSLWLWGSEQGIGLPTMIATSVLPKKSLQGHTSFVLFKHIQEASTARCEGKSFVPQVWQRNTAQDGIPHPSRANMFHARSVPVTGEVDFDIDEPAPLVGKNGVVRGIEKRPMGMDGTRSEASSLPKQAVCSVREMIDSALDEAPLQELDGNLHAPTICGQLASGQAPDMKWRQTSSIAVFPDKETGRLAVVTPAKGRFSPFVELFMSTKVNFLRCDRNFIYSWGPADQPMLGRPVPDQEKTEEKQMMAPARLPIFVQMSASVQTLAIGGVHVLALTCHGRVYQWGEQEACLGPEGFTRHTFRDPTLISGVLEKVRVTRIGAGRVDSACQIEGVDTLQGWEILEASADGRKLEPAVYQYTLSGPRFGPRSGDTRGGRLTMAHSEALQILLVQDMGGGGGGYGPQTAPPGSGRWGKDGEQGRKGPAGVADHGMDLCGTTRKSWPATQGAQDAERRRIHAAKSANTVLAKNFSRNPGNVLFE